MKRKLIGFVAAFPESIYTQRLMEGVFAQCDKYGYDVAVIAPMTQVCLYQKEYLTGELNIFNLINFDRFDGIIVDTHSLTEDNISFVVEKLVKKFEKECRIPVFSVGMYFGNYPALFTRDRQMFREITSHILDVHGCKDIYFLTGAKEHATSMDRLNGFLDEMSSRGLSVPDENIFYGDFWYTSGNKLADRIAAGELRKPEAVICGSDHMALGLINRLSDHGIRVPEDIIVTGFDATYVSAVNPITVTSFIPECAKTAADAVDEIRRMIEPDAEIIPYDVSSAKRMRAGMSCGCRSDCGDIVEQVRELLYHTSHDFNVDDAFETIDVGTLFESYMFESLSNTSDPEKCIFEIFKATYLLRPYGDFYLCLDDKLFSFESRMKVGYPAKMKNVIHATPVEGSGFYQGTELFDISVMHPSLDEEHEKPSVFYFAPVHFLDKTMGYAVIRCDLSQKRKINTITRNWLRNVNNALEITRAQHRLVSLSTRDGMTGAYNRRGMELMLEEMLLKAAPDDSVLAFVIDMDRLKYINDTFGHEAGDFGINAVCDAARQMADDGELCVRAGGDEFYVIGIGKYTDKEVICRIQRFNEQLAEINSTGTRPYVISASVGSACIPLSSGMQVTGIIRIADAKMYENKVRKKQQRT